MKRCTKCGEESPAENFHRARNTKDGRHQWCKSCANAAQRENRVHSYSTEQKRRWHLRGRYDLSVSDVEGLLVEQDGKCGICGEPFVKFLVDHNHLTKKVRGLLCHRCNIRIGGWDDPNFRDSALAWLARGYEERIARQL